MLVNNRCALSETRGISFINCKDLTNPTPWRQNTSTNLLVFRKNDIISYENNEVKFTTTSRPKKLTKIRLLLAFFFSIYPCKKNWCVQRAKRNSLNNLWMQPFDRIINHHRKHVNRWCARTFRLYHLEKSMPSGTTLLKWFLIRILTYRHDMQIRSVCHIVIAPPAKRVAPLTFVENFARHKLTWSKWQKDLPFIQALKILAL